MRKLMPALLLLTLSTAALAQVIRPGRGKSVYVRVEDTARQQPFMFKKQNMFSLSIYDMLFTNITANYEFFTSNGKMGYQLPISINAGGLPDTSQYFVSNAGRFISQRNRIFQTGASINYYPSGQDRVNYYVGCSFTAGWFYYWKYTYSSFPWPVPVDYEKLIGTNVSGLIHAGILFNPRESLILNLRTGFGLRRHTTVFREYTFPFMNFDLCLGFKF